MLRTKKALLLGLCLWAGAVGAKTLSFAILGDAGRENASAKSVRDSLLKTNVRALILPGDNLYVTKDSYEKTWKPWTDAKFTFDVVAIGNHTKGYEEEMAYFKMPSERFSKVYEGKVRFIVLNSDNDRTAAEQGAWLERELDAAKEPLIFVTYHHPSLSVTKFHNWEERESFQKAVRPLLFKYRKKVTALLVGHDHIGAVFHFDDLPVIVSGAVQECRKPDKVDNVQEGIHVKTEWLYDVTPHWAKLDIDTETNTATVKFFRAQDMKGTCEVRLKTGARATLEPSCARSFRK